MIITFVLLNPYSLQLILETLESMIDEYTHKQSINISSFNFKSGGMIESKMQIQPNESDLKSIFVSNIDFNITPNEIEDFFQNCGEIIRITLFNDNKHIHRGHKRGFAYVEFDKEIYVEKALLLNGSILKGNKIKIQKKRTNIPSYHNKKYIGHTISQ